MGKEAQKNIYYMINRKYVPLESLRIKELCVYYCYLLVYNILAGGYKKWFYGGENNHFFNIFQCVCNFYNILFGTEDDVMINQYLRYWLNQLVKHGWLEYCPSGKKTKAGKYSGYYVLKEKKRKYLNTLRKLPCKNKLVKMEDYQINKYLVYENLYRRLHLKCDNSYENVYTGKYKKELNRIDDEIERRKIIFKNNYKKIDYKLSYIYRNTNFTLNYLHEEIPPQELTQQDLQYLDAVKLKQLRNNQITYEDL